MKLFALLLFASTTYAGHCTSKPCVSYDGEVDLIVKTYEEDADVNDTAYTAHSSRTALNSFTHKSEKASTVQAIPAQWPSLSSSIKDHCGLKVHNKLYANVLSMFSESLKDDTRKPSYITDTKCLHAIIINYEDIKSNLKTFDFNFYPLAIDFSLLNKDLARYLKAVTRLFNLHTFTEITVNGHIETSLEHKLFKILRLADTEKLNLNQDDPFTNRAAFSKFAAISRIQELRFIPQFPSEIKHFKNLNFVSFRDFVHVKKIKWHYDLQFNTLQNLNKNIHNTNLTTSQLSENVNILDNIAFLDLYYDTVDEDLGVLSGLKSLSSFSITNAPMHRKIDQSYILNALSLMRNYLFSLSVDISDIASLRNWNTVLKEFLTNNFVLKDLRFVTRDTYTNHFSEMYTGFLRPAMNLETATLQFHHPKNISQLDPILDFIRKSIKLESISLSIISKDNELSYTESEFATFFTSLTQVILSHKTLSNINLAMNIFYEFENKSTFVRDFATQLTKMSRLNRNIYFNGIYVGDALTQSDVDNDIPWIKTYLQDDTYHVYEDLDHLEIESLIKLRF